MVIHLTPRSFFESAQKAVVAMEKETEKDCLKEKLEKEEKKVISYYCDQTQLALYLPFNSLNRDFAIPTSDRDVVTPPPDFS